MLLHLFIYLFIFIYIYLYIYLCIYMYVKWLIDQANKVDKSSFNGIGNRAGIQIW